MACIAQIFNKIVSNGLIFDTQMGLQSRDVMRGLNFIYLFPRETKI